MLKTRLIAASALTLSASLALAAQTVSLDNLVIAIGPTTWRMPHVDVEGSSLPQAELARLFSGDAATIDSRLQKLSASRALVPSMASETRAGTEVERANFRNSTLENIVAGRVGVWRSAGGETLVEPASGAVSRYVWGPMVSKGFDLRQAARIALAPRVAEEPLQPLIEEDIVEFRASGGCGGGGRGHHRPASADWRQGTPACGRKPPSHRKGNKSEPDDYTEHAVNPPDIFCHNTSLSA